MRVKQKKSMVLDSPGRVLTAVQGPDYSRKAQPERITLKEKLQSQIKYQHIFQLAAEAGGSGSSR